MDSDEEINLNVGKPWDEKEDNQLIKEYTIDKLDILKICKIHKRKAGGICRRLKKLNIVKMRKDILGYNEYLENKNQNIEIKNQNIEIDLDITEIKKDIHEIKQNVNKILELMNAVYSFETYE
jgi:hypothetical protein